MQAVHRLVLPDTFMPVLASGSSTGEAGSSGSHPSHLAMALACHWKVSEASAGMAHFCFSRSRIFHQARPISFTWQPPKRARVDVAEHRTQNTTSATFKQVTRPAYTVTLQRDTHAGMAGAVSSLNSLCYPLLPLYIQQSLVNTCMHTRFCFTKPLLFIYKIIFVFINKSIFVLINKNENRLTIHTFGSTSRICH